MEDRILGGWPDLLGVGPASDLEVSEEAAASNLEAAL